MCQSLAFNKASACNFIERENLVQVFFSEFCEIIKNTFFYGTLPVAVSVNKCEC